MPPISCQVRNTVAVITLHSPLHDRIPSKPPVPEIFPIFVTPALKKKSGTYDI